MHCSPDLLFSASKPPRLYFATFASLHLSVKFFLFLPKVVMPLRGMIFFAFFLSAAHVAASTTALSGIAATVFDPG